MLPFSPPIPQKEVWRVFSVYTTEEEETEAGSIPRLEPQPSAQSPIPSTCLVR